jgi:glutamate dehydrogenase
MYFLMENVETISNHIMALYAAKMIAYTKNDTSFDVNLEQETESAAVYIHNSSPGVSVIDGPNYERRIDELYLNKSSPEKAYRLVKSNSVFMNFNFHLFLGKLSFFW